MSTFKPLVQHFLHKQSATFSYVVHDPDSRHAVIIDPVLDFDQTSGRTSTESAQQLVDHIRQEQLTVDWILETHAHADHITAAPWLKDEVDGKIAIGEGIKEVQKTFKTVYNLQRLAEDGSQFDRLLADNETLQAGPLEIQVLATPGHTSDSLSYLIGDAVFVGDSIFAPDLGTARTDFPGGDARTLFHSARRVLALPDETRVYLCHDYPGDRRDYECMHTVSDQRKNNVHIAEGKNEDDFVATRETRDATLGMPQLLIPSVQMNIRAGQLPDAEDDGAHYLKIPLNKL